MGKLNKKFHPMTGASNTRLRKKFAKCKLDDVTRDPEEWIYELELLRGDLWKLGVIIDDVKMMTHILSNLPEEYCPYEIPDHNLRTIASPPPF